MAVFQTSCDEIANLVEDLSGCQQECSSNYDADATLPCTNCCEECIFGCLDSAASNYLEPDESGPFTGCDGNGTRDLASSGCCISSVYGCMNTGANNFNFLVTVAVADSCTYDEAEVTLEDGTTATVVYGCMNADACNHVESANADCNQENAAIAGSDWTQNDDCCDLTKNASCY